MPRTQDSTSNPLIAVVDDDDGVRRSVAALLETDGLDVATFADASSFLTAAKDTTFAVVLLDLRLGRDSGLDVLRQLAPLSMPVLMMSAHGEVSTAVQALKLGAADFVEKPFDPLMLENAVKELIGAPPPRIEAPTLPSDPEPDETLLDPLTEREKEVALALYEGMSNKEVAQNLGCAPRTVEVHRSRVFRKLGVKNLAGMVRLLSTG